jgi:hypothetical protein
MEDRTSGDSSIPLSIRGRIQPLHPSLKALGKPSRTSIHGDISALTGNIIGRKKRLARSRTHWVRMSLNGTRIKLRTWCSAEGPRHFSFGPGDHREPVLAFSLSLARALAHGPPTTANQERTLWKFIPATGFRRTPLLMSPKKSVQPTIFLRHLPGVNAVFGNPVRIGPPQMYGIWTEDRSAHYRKRHSVTLTWNRQRPLPHRESPEGCKPEPQRTASPRCDALIPNRSLGSRPTPLASEDKAKPAKQEPSCPT